jgi:hypothetical protein
LKTILRFLCCASLLVVIVVFADAEPGVSAKEPELEEHPTIEATASPGSTSSNSSSCTITITMTGIVDDSGDLGSK